MTTPTRVVMNPDAETTIEQIAAPALADAAEAIALAIPGQVPVESGTMQRSYDPTVAPATNEGERPQARVFPNSPFWHWLEFGTRWNPPYRPIQRAVEGLGLRYRPL
jgi:hypothetical protein